MSLLLRVAYDGTDFHGFVPQRGLRTVQSVLERALSTIYKQSVTVRPASRTDAGVHAHGQLVAFDPPLAIPERGLLLALAGELPEDVSASAAWSAESLDELRLHPRFHNLGKHYRYRIRCSRLRDPLTARYEWHLRTSLDLDGMRDAAEVLVGRHDFASFQAADCQSKTSVRRMHSVEIVELAPEIVLPDPGRYPLLTTDGREPSCVDVHVHGEAFLKNMVRIMVGSLVDVGLGKRNTAWMEELLSRPDRCRAGRTAPACGLTLEQVKWPEPWPPKQPREHC